MARDATCLELRSFPCRSGGVPLVLVSVAVRRRRGTRSLIVNDELVNKK
jgi:hypothetical protein